MQGSDLDTGSARHTSKIEEWAAEVRRLNTVKTRLPSVFHSILRSQGPVNRALASALEASAASNRSVAERIAILEEQCRQSSEESALCATALRAQELVVQRLLASMKAIDRREMRRSAETGKRIQAIEAASIEVQEVHNAHASLQEEKFEKLAGILEQESSSRNDEVREMGAQLAEMGTSIRERNQALDSREGEIRRELETALAAQLDAGREEIRQLRKELADGNACALQQIQEEARRSREEALGAAELKARVGSIQQEFASDLHALREQTEAIVHSLERDRSTAADAGARVASTLHLIISMLRTEDKWRLEITGRQRALEQLQERRGAEGTGEDIRALSDRIAEIRSAQEMLRATLVRHGVECQHLARQIAGRATTGESSEPKPTEPNADPGPNGAIFDTFYLQFENRFRGSREDVMEKLVTYREDMKKWLGAGRESETQRVVDLRAIEAGMKTRTRGTGGAPQWSFEQLPIRAAGPAIVDLGCGRGEWLEVLGQWNFENNLGVDASDAMVEVCAARGLNVLKGDAISFVSSLPQDSVSMVTAFHLIEHLAFPDLVRLYSETHRALVPGGVCVFETPNPENLLVASQYFFLDPTHRHPLPPDLPAFLGSFVGFGQVDIVRRAPNFDLGFVRKALPESHDDQTVNLILEHFRAGRDYAVVMRKGEG